MTQKPAWNTANHTSKKPVGSVRKPDSATTVAEPQAVPLRAPSISRAMRPIASNGETAEAQWVSGKATEWAGRLIHPSFEMHAPELDFPMRMPALHRSLAVRIGFGNAYRSRRLLSAVFTSVQTAGRRRSAAVGTNPTSV